MIISGHSNLQEVFIAPLTTPLDDCFAFEVRNMSFSKISSLSRLLKDFQRISIGSRVLSPSASLLSRNEHVPQLQTVRETSFFNKCR